MVAVPFFGTRGGTYRQLEKMIGESDEGGGHTGHLATALCSSLARPHSGASPQPVLAHREAGTAPPSSWLSRRCRPRPTHCKCNGLWVAARAPVWTKQAPLQAAADVGRVAPRGSSLRARAPAAGAAPLKFVQVSLHCRAPSSLGSHSAHSGAGELTHPGPRLCRRAALARCRPQ